MSDPATVLQSALPGLGADPTLAPAVLVVLPIVAAAVVLAAGLLDRQSGWLLTLLALVGEAGIAAWLVAAVYGPEGRLVHELGAYGRPGSEGFAVGIELVADGLSAAVVGLVALAALAVLAITRRAGPRGTAFYTAYLLLVSGLMGVAVTGDVFNLFVFLEITGLATYTLVASDRSPASAVAALKYLIVGTTGASLYLVGVGYLFMATGTLNMADLAAILAGEPSFVDGPMYDDPLVMAGFGFVATGLLVKAAIFPLHTWQPDAYAAAPDAVTVLISALVSTVGAYAFARIVLTVFTPAFFAANPAAATAIVTLASASVVAGSALAWLQADVERVFAYSSVSQFGLVVAAIGIAVHPAAVGTGAAEAALVGAVVHLVGHGIVKGGAFAAVAGLSLDAGARRIEELSGLGRRSPVLAACLAVLGLTLVGVPPTVGFLGKWYIAVGAIEAGLWPVAAVILASTLLTLGYVARIVERLYFTPAGAGVETPTVDPDGSEDGAAVAADGGSDADASDAAAADTEGDEAGTDRPDGDSPGGSGSVDRPAGVPLGVVAVAVGAVALAVLLGFAGGTFADALAPFVAEVFGQ